MVLRQVRKADANETVVCDFILPPADIPDSSHLTTAFINEKTLPSCGGVLQFPCLSARGQVTAPVEWVLLVWCYETRNLPTAQAECVSCCAEFFSSYSRLSVLATAPGWLLNTYMVQKLRVLLSVPAPLLVHCMMWYDSYIQSITYYWHVTFVPKNWILCLSSNYVAHLESRNNPGGARPKHRMSISLDVRSQQNILFQEHGAAKENAKMFPFHGWKLPALADLPQAPAGAQRVWILNEPHFPTTKRQWKGKDNTFENWDNIRSWSLLPPFTFSPSLFLSVSSCLPISWDPQHSFRTEFLGRIKWGNEVPISCHVCYGFFWGYCKKGRKKGVPLSHYPPSEHGVSFTSLCCTMFFHEWSV